jgi:hypothetical protein
MVSGEKINLLKLIIFIQKINQIKLECFKHQYSKILDIDNNQNYIKYNLTNSNLTIELESILDLFG